MIEGLINLYHDTQTRPTPAMLQAMVAAKVGDEQNGLDLMLLSPLSTSCTV